MTERYWKTQHEHGHPWFNVARGYWNRYPNPNSKHVFTVDTIETKVIGGQLYTKRFIQKNNPLPRWGEHFFSARRVALIEECYVDPVNKTLTAYVRNIGLTKFMATIEKQTFKSSPIDPQLSIVNKEVWIDSSIYGFRSAIRKFGIDRYKKNCILATQGFEFVLDRLFTVKPTLTTTQPVIHSKVITQEGDPIHPVVDSLKDTNATDVNYEGVKNVKEESVKVVTSSTNDVGQEIKVNVSKLSAVSSNYAFNVIHAESMKQKHDSTKEDVGSENG